MSQRKLEAGAGLPDGEAPQPAAGKYTAEQKAADARRWADADREDDEDGWEDRRLRISTAFSTR